MLGSLLSSVVKVATLPLDVVNAGLAAVDGGDPCDPEDRKDVLLLGDLADARDTVCKIMKEADE